MLESLIFLQFRTDFDRVFERVTKGDRKKYSHQETPKGLPWRPEKQDFRPNFSRKTEVNFGSLMDRRGLNLMGMWRGDAKYLIGQWFPWQQYWYRIKRKNALIPHTLV